MGSISVIVPAYNSGEQLTTCLQAVRDSTQAPLEIIVVDDSSTDDTRDRAAAFGAKVLRTGGRRGPGFGRNLGSVEATGDILFFIDADVCVRNDTIERITRDFESDADLDAVMGSYDRMPGCWNFLSQYRNLMHTFVHQHGEKQASTFWSGCGAIRREIFAVHGGFDESRSRPAIEDIELGYRLILNGRKIMLDHELQVTHLKSWSFWGMIKTDIFDRGIPWTELILSRRFMPNDLNLRFSQRISVVLVFLLAALTGLLIAKDGAHMLIPVLTIVFLMLAGWWTEIRNLVRPRRALVLLSCFVVLLAYQAYLHRMTALVAILLLSPAFVLLMRPSYYRNRTPTWSYVLSSLYIVASLCIAMLALPVRPLLLLWFALLAVLALLNAQFYLFLVEERRIVFMMAAIPLHFLHHFYNGFSFLIGIGRHGWSTFYRPTRMPVKPSVQRVAVDQTGLEESSLSQPAFIFPDSHTGEDR